MNPVWLSPDKTQSTLRVPTSILLNDKKEFEAFGYEADHIYTDMVKENRQHKVYYFRRFKTKIFGVKVTVRIVTNLSYIVYVLGDVTLGFFSTTVTPPFSWTIVERKTTFWLFVNNFEWLLVHPELELNIAILNNDVKYPLWNKTVFIK